MSTSAALAPTSPLPLGSSTKNDPALKPNPHPYAIKTTHTALLSRSNSSGHNTPSKYFYTPSTGTPSHSPTKHAHEYRGHRYSTSLTGELPSPLPSALPLPTHLHRSESEDDALFRRPRADTLPTYLTDKDNTLSVEPEEDLPPNPKIWTPSQLSVYLTRALRVRSGERPPERVANDIALWVRREGVSGRTFLRWTDENLKDLGVNTLWRSALLAAARSLRQNILYGRIWGNPPSDHEQEQEHARVQDESPFGSTLYASSSSSLDLPLTGGDADTGCSRHTTQCLRNGRVRGMVDKWERESTGSRSSTRRSNSSYSRSDSESDNGSELGEGEMAAEEDVDVPKALISVFPDGDMDAVSVADDEPSIEDLLASELASAAPKPGSWGARAWEDLDSGTTMRRMEPHDTVVQRHDISGSAGADAGSAPNFGTLSKHGGGSNNNSSRRVRGTNKEDPRFARRTAANIFAVPPDTVSTPALMEAEVQAGIRAETREEAEARVAEAEAEAEAELKACELALEGEMQYTRAMLEEFRCRLVEVESRVFVMEAEEKQRAHVSLQQQEQPSQEISAAAKDTHDNAAEALPPKKAGTISESDPSIAVEVPVDTTTDADESQVRRDHDTGGACANGHVARPVVEYEPTTVSDLPSYVLLVGLGVCAVVFKVVLNRVGCRSLKP